MYLTKQFLAQFGKDKEARNRFVKFIHELNVDIEYTVIGYGSLMNQKDAERTFNDISNFELGTIREWERVFNMGTVKNGAYLNVRECEWASISVALITISAEDYIQFYLREFWYDLVSIEAVNSNNEKIQATMVVGRDNINEKLNPMLNYVMLCLKGIQELGGNERALRFLEDTRTVRGSLKEYLESLDLISHMLTMNYVNR